MSKVDDIWKSDSICRLSTLLNENVFVAGLGWIEGARSGWNQLGQELFVLLHILATAENVASRHDGAAWTGSPKRVKDGEIQFRSRPGRDLLADESERDLHKCAMTKSRPTSSHIFRTVEDSR